MAASSANIARWRSNLRDERDSAELYRRVAAVEDDAGLASVYGRLAEAEERHAEFWAQRLRDAGQPVPAPRVGWRTKALGVLARRFGTAFVVPTIDAMEQADAGSYDAQPEAAATALPGEERSHARLLQAIGSDQRGGLQGAALARLEGRHRAASGNSLRAAVLGANDGLVSNFSLVMGVAGASLSNQQILITGLAVMVWVRFVRFPPYFRAYERQLAKQRYFTRERFTRPESTIRSRSSRRRRRR